MTYWLKLTLIFAFIFSASCTQKKAAQVVNNSKSKYVKGSTPAREKVRSKNAGTLSERSLDDKLAVKKSAPEKSVKASEIVVETGETLYSVSRKYQISIRDLVAQNHLNPPYILKPGDRLSIPSATYHEVKNGETLYSISRIYGMKVDQLVEMNNLHEPYSVKVGEKIKISKNSTEAVATNTKIEENNQTVEPEKPANKVGFVANVLDKSNRFSWPLRGAVVSKFGPKSGGLYNDGINIKAKDGAEVKAAEDGVVAYVGNELKGYGNLVIVKHGSGWITAYAHLKNWTVKRGEKIKKGQKVGLVGATGNVDSPQLYFGLRKGRDAVNPEAYLK